MSTGDSWATIASIGASITSLFVGGNWILTGGGNWPAFLLWSALMVGLGALLCWATHGSKWKSKAQGFESVSKEVTAKLELAEANAENAVSALGMSLEEIHLRNTMLGAISIMDKDEAHKFLCARIDEDRDKYGPAIADLIKYECVEDLACPQYAGGRYVIYTGAKFKVTRSTYPTLSERNAIDLKLMLEQAEDNAVKKVFDSIDRAMRMNGR